MTPRILPAYPLLTSDPYFSIWSETDALYDSDVMHWTGAKKPVYGTITVDGTPYRFLGTGQEPNLEQTACQITATQTIYTFEGAGISLTLAFVAPLLLDDLTLLSTPVNYIESTVTVTDGNAHDVAVEFFFEEGHVYDSDTPKPLLFGEHTLTEGHTVWMGQKHQTPLGHSGDNITIDWGYLYLASATGALRIQRREDTTVGGLAATFTGRIASTPVRHVLAVGYDDILSIFYFDTAVRGYWTKKYSSILQALGEGLTQYSEFLERCVAFDKDLAQKTSARGGKAYTALCAASYRQAIAAHKLIADEQGNPIFLSKECFSNGCIGTVDVSYPSAPLFLLYAPELVLGMLRPIFEFASLPVWEYDYAPHDVGRYPYATGQVYGVMVDGKEEGLPEGAVYPMFYQYPADQETYLHRMQMPVEECGNMLLLAAAYALRAGSAQELLPYRSLLSTWAEYLMQHGLDPGEQLCTDDFAGHLDHNINLSAKAIMSLEAYSQLLTLLGEQKQADYYHTTAQKMAEHWLAQAQSKTEKHTHLTFSPAQGWSLKYNIIWDKLFGSGLFPPELFEQEVDWYLMQNNTYGAPLDSRKEYTKSDWLLWTASMTKDMGKFQRMIAPVYEFLLSSPDRVPFSDWYDTKTGEHFHFQNRTVQGGIFMPLLTEEGLSQGAQ